MDSLKDDRQMKNCCIILQINFDMAYFDDRSGILVVYIDDRSKILDCYLR